MCPAGLDMLQAHRRQISLRKVLGSWVGSLAPLPSQLALEHTSLKAPCLLDSSVKL